MGIWDFIWIAAGLGALGGIANSAVSGEFVLPRKQSGPNGISWRPGWIGNVLVGAIAAVVVAGLYGPLSQVQINPTGPQSLPPVTVAQILGAIVVGMGGGTILTKIAQLQSERLAKENLVLAIDDIRDSIAGLNNSGPDAPEPEPGTPEGE